MDVLLAPFLLNAAMRDVTPPSSWGENSRSSLLTAALCLASISATVAISSSSIAFSSLISGRLSSGCFGLFRTSGGTGTCRKAARREIKR